MMGLSAFGPHPQPDRYQTRQVHIIALQPKLPELPNLKYTKQILYHHIQRQQGILVSMKNAQPPKWSKDQSESGSRKAGIAAQNVEQDFMHLLDRALTVHH